MNQRYFCKSSSGRDLLYINIDDFDNLDSFHFESSLPFQVINDDDLKPLITIVCDKNITETERVNAINLLFEKIKMKPDIEFYYLPDYTLNGKGEYLEFYANTIAEVLGDITFPDYTGFSEETNFLYFECFQKIFNLLKKGGKLKSINNEHFIQLLPYNPALQYLYVESLSTCNKFFYYQEEDNGNYMDFYIMETDDKLSFFFIRKTT